MKKKATKSMKVRPMRVKKEKVKGPTEKELRAAAGLPPDEVLTKGE